MSNLNLEQNRAFEDILHVFTLPGWKLLQKELATSIARIADVRTTKDLSFAQGQLDVLDQVARWDELWRNLHQGAVDGTIEVSPEFGNAGV